MKDKLEKISAYIDVAHETLVDPGKRKKYDRTLKLLEKDSPVNLGMAREKFIKGWDRLRAGDYAGAARLFGEAVYYGPSAKNHYYHGLSLARLGDHKEAERALREAVMKDPGNPDYLAEIGHVYLDLGLPKRARGNFDRAARLQPGHKRALEGASRLQKGRWD
jgi:tetratricopeptide (TPR) repeat protein